MKELVFMGIGVLIASAFAHTQAKNKALKAELQRERARNDLQR